MSSPDPRSFVRGLERALWHAPAQGSAPLEGACDSDVAVVGGGIVGSSVALHLAELGVSCALLEAGEIGCGASGRNTGFVVPALNAALGPREIVERLGAGRGEELARLTAGAARFLFALVERLGIDCGADARGFLQPAPHARQVPGLEARVADWRRLDAPVRLLDEAGTARRTGTSAYRGAIEYVDGGTIDPLAYVRGLSAGARAAGGKIFARSPVERMAASEGGWVLRTPGGEIRARRVVLATNAFVGALAPELARSLLPVRVHQIATAPLAAADRAVVLPDGGCATDMHRDSIAFRLTPDGRLVGGGIAAIGPGADARLPPFLLGRFRRLFPSIVVPAPTHVWNGVIAVTRDFMPRLVRVAPGCHALIACNGRGNALGTALGAALARSIAADDLAAFPLPETPAEPIAMHALARLAPRLWLPWARLRDRIDSLR